MPYIGIDVGGTNLKAGLVDGNGAILATERVPLDFQGAEAFSETLADLSRSVAEKGGVEISQIPYVGIGIPGAVADGEILFTTNILMEHVPLEKLFRAHLDLPLLLGNDADCAAVGEYCCGAAQGIKDLLFITLGTGVGGGIILNGKLRGGIASSEAGHIVIVPDGEPCNCGRKGCWEQYASATALIRMTKEAMAQHPESALHAVAAQNGGVEGRTAFDAAKIGDAAALDVCRAYVEHLASGAISLINVLRPEVLAIGGGVAAAPDELLLNPLQELIAKESFGRHGGRQTKVVRAELGNDAGLIGAALLSRVM